MKLALSNFAWDTVESESIFNIIKKNGITGIECVLTKIKDWSELTPQDIINYKSFLNDNGITPYSIQSLFYNVKCFDVSDTETIISHFIKVIEYAKILEAKILVFGSPSLRKAIFGWEDYLATIFKEVDKVLSGTNIIVAIEPNSSAYGGEFFITISEIVDFIKKYGFANIKTMIDTHNLELENLSPTIEFLKYVDYITHIHVSEKNLMPLKPNDSHFSLSDTIKKYKYNGIITYEVNKSENLTSSLIDFCKIYEKN